MLLIIDGNNMCHRAKHVFDLSNHGIDVSVTYGFLRMMSSYIRKYAPTSVLVAWDGGIPEFRRRAVPEYKANRHKDDDPADYENFLRQMRELGEILPLCGVLSVRHPGAEADDIIYHAAKFADDDTIIASSDKDLYQCISDDYGVRILKPGMNSKDDKIVDLGVFDELGIERTQYIDWRAIQGDSSDNIPGVRGIGEKTATVLMKEFGDLSGVYNAAMNRNPKGKLSEAIATGILSFGQERLYKNVLVMALYADRVGARWAILNAEYPGLDTKALKQYLMKNAFVSLMDGEFVSGLKKLDAPSITIDDVVPLTVGRRVSN